MYTSVCVWVVWRKMYRGMCVDGNNVYRCVYVLCGGKWFIEVSVCVCCVEGNDELCEDEQKKRQQKQRRRKTA